MELGISWQEMHKVVKGIISAVMEMGREKWKWKEAFESLNSAHRESKKICNFKQDLLLMETEVWINGRWGQSTQKAEFRARRTLPGIGPNQIIGNTCPIAFQNYLPNACFPTPLSTFSDGVTVYYSCPIQIVTVCWMHPLGR